MYVKGDWNDADYITEDTHWELAELNKMLPYLSILVDLFAFDSDYKHRTHDYSIDIRDDMNGALERYFQRKKSKHRFSFGRKVQHGILGRVKDKLKKNNSNVMLESSVPTTQTCPVCGCLTKHSLDKRLYHCEHCGYDNPDRDIHSANMMVLLSGYGTYRSLKTDTVSTKKMVGLLTELSNLGVVVTTNSMEACYF